MVDTRLGVTHQRVCGVVEVSVVVSEHQMILLNKTYSTSFEFNCYDNWKQREIKCIKSDRLLYMADPP